MDNEDKNLQVPKKTQRKIELEACNYVINLAGDSAHLAKMIGVAVSVTSAWKRRGRISKKGVEKICQHPFFKKEGVEPIHIRLDYNVEGGDE